MATAKEILEELEELAEEKTFTVPLGKSEIVFRRPDNATETYAIRRFADKQAEVIRVTPSEVYKPYKGLPPDLIRQACWVHKMAQEPPFTLAEALELASVPAALTYLYQSIVQGIGLTIAKQEADQVEETKNA